MCSNDTLPLVSVIVPAFNCELYLEETIASLAAQTLREIEIIVIDDGSTDRTAQLAMACAESDSRVRLVSRIRASGRPACARNDGLRAARGRYIALLDADDIAVPTRIASCIAAMQQTGARFAFADYRHLHQESGTLERRTVLESTGFLRRAASYLCPVGGEVYLCEPTFPAFLLTSTAVNTPTVVFERALLDSETTWFDESMVCSEDVDLWFRLAEHTRFVFISQVHALNRRHSASLTASNPIPTKLDAITVRRAHLKRLEPALSQTELAAARASVANLLWDFGYSNWCLGQLRSARSAFLDCWRTKPTLRAAVGYFKAFIPRDLALGALARVKGSAPRF